MLLMVVDTALPPLVSLHTEGPPMQHANPSVIPHYTDSNCSLASVEAAISTRDARAFGSFKDLWLTSAFQPVYSLAHRRAIGHEALMRANTAAGTPVSPLDVFAQTTDETEITRLDRLCRTLHVRNYRSARQDDSWLFLNVSPAVVIHGKNYGAFFAQLLERYGFPPQRVVIEILEEGILEEALLAEAVEYYRRLGCLVAIDDFGSGHSNFERIWELAPDIVKLDRSMIVRAASRRNVRRILPNLVSLLHEAGCLVLMEGVETETEALICMDADVDFVQGYYFARPAADIAWVQQDSDAITALCGRFKRVALDESRMQHASAAAYLAAFQQCAQALIDAAPLEIACIDLFDTPGVARCYLLDAEGTQTGPNLLPARGAARTDQRFAPLSDVAGANWVRRAYFRRAIDQPGQIQMSRPYLSLTGINMCVTLSVALEVDNVLRVMCCDIDVEALEGAL